MTTSTDSSKRLVTSDGATISYSDRGAGQPVVLLAGFGCNRRHWAFQEDVLVEAGFRVLAVDLRFHGDSESPEFGQRISRLGMDIGELIEQEQLRDAVLVGHSMGVSVALAYIDLVGCAGIAKFVAIDQSPRIVNDDEWQLGVRGVTWEKIPLQVTGREPWGDPGREPAKPADVRAMVAAAGGIGDFITSPLMALKLDHFVSDWRDVVARISVPTWVATGAHSPSYPHESMTWFAETAPQASLTTFADSGHCPHWNEHELFNRQLLDFIGTRTHAA